MDDFEPIDGERLLIWAIHGKFHPHIKTNVDMRKITWFRSGGKAEVLFEPESEGELAEFLQALPADIPVSIVGIGSNLLIRDGGIKGVVIRLSVKGFGTLHASSDQRIIAGAAVSGKRLAAMALASSIGGFHFYHGIPGAVGGALRMNAGANGLETAERVLLVTCLDRKGNRWEIPVKEMEYQYRHSGVAEDLIFISARFQGWHEDKNVIKAAMDAVQHHRETVQPIREKTGGSTFRNPKGHSAWKLIDEAHCRGLCFGNAQMSPLHCNFMINKGEATAYELETLGEMVRQKVFTQSRIALDWEIKRIGQFESGKVIVSQF